uniref:TMEM205-like domain-containing protein n=2 Tax=Oryza TaxID=4527 RepID=A0A0E0H121_ORYNI
MHFYRGSLCFFALSPLHSTHWNWKLTSVRPMPRRAALAMMNVVAIGLVLSTLAAAGVWSPAPTPPPSTAGEHVVREGRRVVIVEYEREHPLYPGDAVKETHVLPPDSLDGGEGRLTDKARGAVSDAADRVADAAEGGKEKMSDAKESATGKVFGAVKRCKDRLCGAAREAEEGAKDKASAGEHSAEEAARGAEEALSHAKEIAEDKVFDAASKVKETAVGAKDKVSEAAGKAKERASHVQHGAAETMRNAKDKVSHAARHARESARERAMDAKDRVSDVAERAEQCTEDAAGRAARKAARAEEAVKAKAGEAASNLSDIARRARDVASDAAAHLLGGGPREAARTATAVMHLLGFAAAYGASLWVTFVSSYVLAAALPRQQLAMVQSKLFPMYFRAVAYGVGLALAAHLLGRERSSLAARAQSVNLLAALALVLANMLLLEPKATKVMFERMKVEKEEGRGRDMADIVDPPTVTVAAGNTATTTTVPTAAARKPAGNNNMAAKSAAAAAPVDEQTSKSRVATLNQRLKKLNGYSSLCNVLCLMALTWHLVHLARRLQMASVC